MPWKSLFYTEKGYFTIKKPQEDEEEKLNSSRRSPNSSSVAGFALEFRRGGGTSQLVNVNHIHTRHLAGSGIAMFILIRRWHALIREAPFNVSNRDRLLPSHTHTHSPIILSVSSLTLPLTDTFNQPVTQPRGPSLLCAPTRYARARTRTHMLNTD